MKSHFSFSQWYLYSSVRKFVIEGTDENGENWYITNNNQFTVPMINKMGSIILILLEKNTIKLK